MSEEMETAIEFANKVRAELRHLPTETIADLTDGLEVDIASSLADGAELGSPEKYASDLLYAAGLSMPESDDRTSVKDNFDRVSQIIRMAWNSISDLAPAWWVFRAWVATQLIGLFLFHEPNGSPGFYEWNNRPYIGFALFVVLVTLSVRVGRMSIPKLRSLLLVSHVLLTVGAILMMFSSPRIHEWYVYQSDGPYPTTTMADQPNCELSRIPNVTNLNASKAQQVLSGDFVYSYFDVNTNHQIAPTEMDTEDPIIQEQFPLAGNEICTVRQPLKLWVSLKSTSPIGNTPTTVTSGSTNIPGDTTTTAPKVTTTTKP